MTTVEIQLPDQLAQDAQRAGLLTPERLAHWLREQLAQVQTDALFAAMDSMQAVDAAAALTPEDVALEVAAMRAERRLLRL